MRCEDSEEDDVEESAYQLEDSMRMNFKMSMFHEFYQISRYLPKVGL